MSEPTVKDLLEKIANGEKFDGELEGKEEIFLQNLMRKCGFPKCIITCGIVYAEGKGTLEFPPSGMTTYAKTFLKAAENGM